MLMSFDWIGAGRRESCCRLEVVVPGRLIQSSVHSTIHGLHPPEMKRPIPQDRTDSNSYEGTHSSDHSICFLLATPCRYSDQKQQRTPSPLSLSTPSNPLVPSPSPGAGYGFPCAGVLPGVGTCGAAIVGTSQVDSPVLIWTK